MSEGPIVPIVEGHGEVGAVPVLLRRWLAHRGFGRQFDVPSRAIRACGAGALKAPFDPRRHVGVEHYMRWALAARPAGVLILLDVDDECRQRTPENPLGPELLERARDVAGKVPVSVVVANREYEAWFLASLSRLRHEGHFIAGARLEDPLEPEQPRDCKGRIAALLGRRYEETVDQAELTGSLSFSPGTRRRSPSFDKLLRELEDLARMARQRRRARCR